MEKHKTVTASEGYEFKITSTKGNSAYYANSYDDGYPAADEIRFKDRALGYLHRWVDPIIELVEISKPEPERVRVYEVYRVNEGHVGTYCVNCGHQFKDPE